MQCWSFCAFSVLLLCLPSADSSCGLLAVGKAAWLTQSCVGVLKEPTLFTLLLLAPSQLFSGCSFCLSVFVCDME